MQLGEKVGSYTLTDKIGEGGMGAVFLAEHKLIGRKAAIKVLLPELSTNPDVIARFFNEAKATTAIHHPAIVAIFDFGHLENGAADIVMEYLEGEALTSRLRRVKPLPVETAVNFARQIAGGLAAAHARGITHRDLKPDNVILVPDSEVPGGERCKILDFGIAKVRTEGTSGPATKTRTGSVMGTPVYMAPEQCRGLGNIDHRTDIYALGCILFEFVCGRPPFVSEGIGELIAAHIYSPPPTPRSLAPNLPLEIDAVIQKLLAKAPEARYQTMDEVVQALDAAVGRHTGGVPVAMGDFAGTGQHKLPSQPGVMPVGTGTEAKRTLALGGADSPPPAPGEQRKQKTTLGSAAGETVPPTTPKKKMTVPLVAGAAVLVVGATLGIMQPWKSSGSKEPQAVVQPQPAPTPPTPLVEPKPEPVKVDPPVVEPNTPAKPMVMLSLDSEPQGAEVYNDQDEILGKTPFELTVEKSGVSMKFTLKLEGYADKKVAFMTDKDRMEIFKLKKRSGSSKTDPTKTDPTKTDPVKTDPKKIDPNDIQ